MSAMAASISGAGATILSEASEEDASVATTASSRSLRMARQKAARAKREAMLTFAYSRIGVLELRITTLHNTLNAMASQVQIPLDSGLQSIKSNEPLGEDIAKESTAEAPFLAGMSEQTFSDNIVQADRLLGRQDFPVCVVEEPAAAIVAGLEHLAEVRLAAHAASCARAAEVLSGIDKVSDAPLLALSCEKIGEVDYYSFDLGEAHISMVKARLKLFQEAARRIEPGNVQENLATVEDHRSQLDNKSAVMQMLGRCRKEESSAYSDFERAVHLDIEHLRQAECKEMRRSVCINEEDLGNDWRQSLRGR